MTLDLAEKICRQTSVDRDVSMVSAKIERQLYCKTRELPGVALVNSAISQIFRII